MQKRSEQRLSVAPLHRSKPRGPSEEKFRRTGEEQEASATKLSTETWALKVKVLTDSITKLPPGTTRDSAEAQLQKLLDETPG